MLAHDTASDALEPHALDLRRAALDQRVMTDEILAVELAGKPCHLGGNIVGQLVPVERHRRLQTQRIARAQSAGNESKLLASLQPVSYTHLNYYKLSTIAKSGNQEIEIFQMFKDRPVEYATVGWVAVGDLACNVFVPYYPMLIDSMYEGYQAGTPTVQFTTEQPTGGLFYPYSCLLYTSRCV